MVKRYNFSEISALVLDADRFSTGIIGQILHGFGMSHIITTATGSDAKRRLTTQCFHLLIAESMLPDMPLADLVGWARRHTKNEIRYMPIVVLTGYAQFSRVTAARDAGVSSVVRKPVSPATLFDHLIWAARTDRSFIEADQFAGPDRRFRRGVAAPELQRRMDDGSISEAMLPTQAELP